MDGRLLGTCPRLVPRSGPLRTKQKPVQERGKGQQSGLFSEVLREGRARGHAPANDARCFLRLRLLWLLVVARRGRITFDQVVGLTPPHPTWAESARAEAG